MLQDYKDEELDNASDNISEKRILTRRENEILFESMQNSKSAIEFLHNFIATRSSLSEPS